MLFPAKLLFGTSTPLVICTRTRYRRQWGLVGYQQQTKAKKQRGSGIAQGIGQLFDIAALLLLCTCREGIQEESSGTSFSCVVFMFFYVIANDVCSPSCLFYENINIQNICLQFEERSPIGTYNTS